MPDLSTLRAALTDLHTNRAQSPLLARALGMRPIPNPVNLAADTHSGVGQALEGKVSEFYRVGEASFGGATAGLYLAYLDEWSDRSSDREPYRRRVAKVLVDRMVTDGRWVCVLLDHAGRPNAEVILPRRREGSPPGTVRAAISLTSPTHFHLDRLAALDVGHAATLPALARSWNEAFSVENVTKRFYEDFRLLRDRLVLALVDNNAANPAVAARVAALPTEASQSRAKFEKAVLSDLPLLACGTRQLGRLLFVWFLQQKRWFGASFGAGSEKYLLDLFQQFGGNDSYFGQVLVPLFFDGIGQSSQSKPHRDVEARFGKVPYLGGGLFRPDAFEEELFGIPASSEERTLDVSLPDSLFDPAKDDPRGGRTILGFLNSYRFTTQESTPDDQSVDPDPELLGKVFENLYQGDDRHDTGAYYTPREIVHYMCRQVLDGYLMDETAITQDTLDQLRLGAINWEKGPQLDPTTQEALHHALDRVTILDPAVGSGAFLVGSMQEIVLLRRGLEQSIRSYDIDPKDLEVAEWKRRAVTQSLHGVDINPMAVEICKLRLWLSLAIDQEPANEKDLIPLPDLDFRILAGDSLVDRMGAEPFIQSLPVPADPNSGWQLRLDIRAETNKLQNEVESLKLRFLGEGVTAWEKREYARRIRRDELKIARIQLDEALERARGVIAAQAKREREGKRVTATEKRAAQAHIDGLERLDAGLHEDAAFQKPFLWPVNFHEVLVRGGFDIVLANPPYVRMENIDNTDEESFGYSFRQVAASRADLLVYFYARALQVLKTRGQLAFITSNSFVKRAYGGGLRRLLGEELTISKAVDFGELSVFDATVEPYILIGQRCPPPDGHRLDGHFLFVETVRRAGTKSSVARVREQLEELPALLSADHVTPTQASFVGSGWKLESDEIVRLFERLVGQGTPMGKFTAGRIFMGVKTGLNEAFVIDDAKRAELIAADAMSAQVIKPWLRGKDIRRWVPQHVGLHLIFANRHFAIDRYPAIRSHLAKYRPALERRATAHSHPWYELQQPQEGFWNEFEQPKVIWPDISRSLRFAWDEGGFFSGNTTYFAPRAPKWLVGVLNSDIMEFVVCQLTNSVPGGFVRLFTDCIELLPVVEPNASVARTLGAAVETTDQATANSVVAQLYGVSEEERRLLNDWFERRSLLAGGESEGEDDASGE